MIEAERIREHAKVIGADGIPVGTVDRVVDGRIKLTKRDSGEGSHEGHHHFIPLSLVAYVDGDTVRLSSNGSVSVSYEQEENGSSAH
ncbi:hypothetical protein J2858_002527 [Neorhizobium galegae]|uniref:DUF2171 domain-containing protein n=1 Tax=Neorhizobium galegae TaxID=399 RepID=UPI001AEA96F6|nr:DUF2171 domain-containing protein [Neorhizobium galegae]MBP2549604.1 hypothetical protein [Neorhizobium galegae]